MAKNPLATWDATRKQQYRATHPDQVLTFHFVLDGSPSMIGAPAKHLLRAYEIYLGWLQEHADPMSLLELTIFSTACARHPVLALGACQPLTEEDYNPRRGNGTALYRAVGEVCTAPVGTGQHVLVVFTDGMDSTHVETIDSHYGPATSLWTSTKVREVLTTLQEQEHWATVFLGAFPEALEVGKAMGFPAGNCLVFPSDLIPEAFETLLKATEQYLLATPAERKLLAAGNVFQL